MSRFGPLRESVQRQLAANPRLRWAMVLIALLLIALAWQGVDSVRKQAQQDAIEAEVDLRRIRSLQGQDVWVQRAEESAQVERALLAELPETASPGLAQATLQTWLRDTGATATGRDIRVTVEPATQLERPEGVLKVAATVSGNVSARQAQNFVRQIEASKNLMVVESISIRSDQNSVFTLNLSAYYRLQPRDDAP